MFNESSTLCKCCSWCFDVHYACKLINENIWKLMITSKMKKSAKIYRWKKILFFFEKFMNKKFQKERKKTRNQMSIEKRRVIVVELLKQLFIIWQQRWQQQIKQKWSEIFIMDSLMLRPTHININKIQCIAS